MFHILLQKLVYNTQRVCIGGGIKIQGTTQKMFYRICNKKLVGRGCVAANFKINAFYIMCRRKCAVVNRRRFIGVLIGERIRAFDKIVESIDTNRINIVAFCIANFISAFAAYFYVTDVYFAMKTGKIYIQPVRIFRLLFKESAVL